MTKYDQPAFFKELDTFTDSIADTPETIPEANHLLASYLDHYSIDLVKEGNASLHEIWKSNINGYRIVEQRWQPTNTNGKVFILCHGYFDHTALYGKLIRWGLERGYTFHSFDLPGHGLSSGKQAAIDHFDAYSQVLSTIIKREDYLEYSLIGQSTGCAVILNSILNRSLNPAINRPPQNITLLAPLVRTYHWEKLRWLYFLLKYVIRSIKRTFISSSHDKEFNQFLKNREPLQTKRIPLCWLGAMDLWIKQIKQFSPLGNIPTTIIQGTDDHTVDWHYNHPQIQRCLPQAIIHFVDDAYHHLVKESDEYWQQVVQLLNKHH
jgi:lysophospholipase